MPMPTPTSDEEQDKFMDRCMADESMVTEFDDEKQRYAVCQKQWDTAKEENANPATKPEHMEVRVLSVSEDIELRVEMRAGKPILAGYAARFNKDSVDLGGFVERIKPGAFKNAVAKSDVRALKNHDPNLILGRTKNKTLTLTENTKGLKFEVNLPDTQTGRDVAEEVRRGDISGCSFAFTTMADSWHLEDGRQVRELVEVDTLFDIGPVTYPAYTDTTVAVRSLEQFRKRAADSVTETPTPEPQAATVDADVQDQMAKNRATRDRIANEIREMYRLKG